MFDSLGDIWNANQQRLEQEGVRPGQMNTAGIAGQLIASGMMPQQAYVQAAKIFRDQENTNLQAQKQEVRMQQAHTASQILQNGGGLAEMLAAGISDPGILGALPQPQYIANPHEPGGGSFKYPGLRGQGNPSEQRNMQPSQGGMAPPQQTPQTNMNMGNNMPISAPALGGDTPAERQANIDVQKKAQIETNKTDEKFEEKIRDSFMAAQDSKRLLKKLEKSFDSYDKNAPSWVRPGSILANTQELGPFNTGQTRAILHNDKTINEATEIHKIGAALQSKLLVALESAKAAGNVYLEKRLEAGLPNIGAPKGARENIIKDYRDVIAIADLMYKARGSWEKMGNGRKSDVAGLVEFIMRRNDDSVTNNKGELDPKILKDLPDYITEYKMYKENPGMEFEEKQNKPTIFNEDEMWDQENERRNGNRQ